MPLSGKQGTTDANGGVELVTDTLVSGNIALQAGNSNITLFGVKTNADIVLYKATIDQRSGNAAVKTMTEFPLREDSISKAPSCTQCHGVMGEPDCTNGQFVQKHTNIFNCKPGTGGSASISTCLNCHGERGAPQCGDPVWKSIHRTYPCNGGMGVQNPGSWQCTSCHANKGHSECGNAEWEKVHNFVSCENGTGAGTLHCNSCHELKTQPECNNRQWRADHPFWQCGNNSSSCTSCHTYKGSPKCNDGYWKTIHPFYSCETGPSCSACHAPKNTTNCESSSWRNIHNFNSSGMSSRVGGTAAECSSCHDNNRGGPQCGDTTWENFHCFCG